MAPMALLLALGFCTLSRAETPAPPAVLAAPAPAPLPVFPENQDNGWYLGLRGGLVDSNREDIGLGLAPKWRFGRFFSLEGEAMGSIRSGKRLDAALYLMAQLTFHSALFSFTPKAGLGASAYKSRETSYQGPAAKLGLEVEFGNLILSGEMSGSLANSTSYTYVACAVPMTRYPNEGNYYYCNDSYYPSQRHSFTRAEVGIAFKTNGKDRLGCRMGNMELGGGIHPGQYIYYEIGF